MADSEIQTRHGVGRRAAMWIVAGVIAGVAFYALNHLMMSLQGLPLAWDLSPLQ